jgi:hypothetical protein
VAGFCFQPQQPTTLGDRPWSKNPNGPLQLRIANLMKPGPLEQQGEGGLPSLLQPWMPRMCHPHHLTWNLHQAMAGRSMGWPIGNLQLRVATANEAFTWENSSKSVRTEAGSAA